MAMRRCQDQAEGWARGEAPSSSAIVFSRAVSVRRLPFPPDVIMLAVRWYLRFGLSYRDLEELLAERGIVVDHVTLFRWVQRFTPLLIDAARPCRHTVGARWLVDETYVKVAGVWRYVSRAMDEHDQVIDVLVLRRRDIAAAYELGTEARHYQLRVAAAFDELTIAI